MNAKNLRVDMFGMRITSHKSYSKHWEKQWNDLERTIYTVGENIIATTLIRNNYVTIQSFIFSNIAIAIFDFSLLIPI